MPYYLWKDKRSTEDNLIVYITDYKEVSADGKVQIDGQGRLDVELIFTGKRKIECIDFAQKQMNKK